MNENVVKENVVKENVVKENVVKENVVKENVYKEIEYKYMADKISLYDFETLMNKLGFDKNIFVKSKDDYFSSSESKVNFVRYRYNDTYQELTEVFSEPQTRMIGPSLTWVEFWKEFASAKVHDSTQLYEYLDIAGWLPDKMAFGNDGVRMIAR